MLKALTGNRNKLHLSVFSKLGPETIHTLCHFKDHEPVPADVFWHPASDSAILQGKAVVKETRSWHLGDIF